jgi:hypothetical protein
MKLVREQLQKDKCASNPDGPTGPYCRFHKRNPMPTRKDVAGAARAAKRRHFNPAIAAE